ncbi:MAG TPA: hypothetical protein VKC66_31210, partial [Xanthobacteraceae bacterium]|nr:hypothetical protein [Xanthobacteraceae bacterium]
GYALLSFALSGWVLERRLHRPVSTATLHQERCRSGRTGAVSKAHGDPSLTADEAQGAHPTPRAGRYFAKNWLTATIVGYQPWPLYAGRVLLRSDHRVISTPGYGSVVKRAGS